MTCIPTLKFNRRADYRTLRLAASRARKAQEWPLPGHYLCSVEPMFAGLSLLANWLPWRRQRVRCKHRIWEARMMLEATVDFSEQQQQKKIIREQAHANR